MTGAAIVGIGATEFSKNSGRSELQASRRSGPGRPRRRWPAARRRQRPGHVRHGQQRRGRRRPRTRHQRADVLQPDRLRRRSRVRDRSSGRDGGHHRRGRRGRLLPRDERTLRPPLRPGLGRRDDDGDLVGDRQRLALPDGLVHSGRHGRDGRPPVHARLRRDQRRLRGGRRGRPQARRDQPERLVLPAADHAGRAPGLPLDHRAAAAARLLPGKRRRRRDRRDQRGTGHAPCATGRP